MDIVINLQSLQDFFRLPPDIMLWRLLSYYGWIIFGIMYIAGAKVLWLMHIRRKWYKGVKFVMLAIDIPRANVQSPRAVENMFAYLAGGHGSVNFFEKYWEGKFQVAFSLEIASIDGYTQFLIRTPVDLRHLVETGVYSQYPDAEIVEVDDYTNDLPRKFPNDEYDVWGSEFIQSGNAMLPIRVYKDFEHLLGPSEMVFKDPMAALMDLCSSLQPGEQLWYQIIIVPTGFDWIIEAEPAIDKILGIKPSKVTAANKGVDAITAGLSEASEWVYQLWGDIDDKKKDEKKPKSMMELRPKEKRQVEAMHMKVSKIGFMAKIRFVYIAKKEVFNPKKVVNGFVGYIKQFTALDLNGLKPDMSYTATSTAYFKKIKRLNERKNNIVNNYIGRDDSAGRNPGLYNVEELATLWHFPVEASVSAPLIQKAPGKKAKPPMSLPSENSLVYTESLQPIFSFQEATSPAVAPENNSEEEVSSDAEVFQKSKSYSKPGVVDISGAYSGPAPASSLKESPIVNLENDKGQPPGNLPFG